MTVAEMFAESIEMRMAFPAYVIYWALQNNKIYDDDDALLVSLLTIDKESIDELIESDPLQINKIKAFSITIEKGIHHIVLSESPEDALKLLRVSERAKVQDVTSRMHVDFWNDDSGYAESLEDIRKTVSSFPHYAFVLNTNKPTLEEIEHEYYRIDR